MAVDSGDDVGGVAGRVDSYADDTVKWPAYRPPNPLEPAPAADISSYKFETIREGWPANSRRGPSIWSALVISVGLVLSGVCIGFIVALW